MAATGDQSIRDSLDPTVVKGPGLVTLIADADSGRRTSTVRVARGRGHIVIEAETAAKAFDLFAAQQPHLLIFAPSLPDMTGLDAARRIRAVRNGRDAYMLLAVAPSRTPDLHEALRAGFDDSLPSDPDPVYLEARLIAAERVISDRREQRTTRRRAHRAAAMESVATLARGIAHDINNALGPIIGYTQLVQRSFAPGDKNFERLESVLRSCERTRHLVEQVLLFSRIGQAEAKPVDVLAMMSDVAARLKAASGPAAASELVLDLPDSLPLLPGDRRYLTEAIAAIALNGLEAMNGKGQLSLEVDTIYLDALTASNVPRLSSGQFIVIRIRDSGPGIPPEILPQIFDPFFTTKERQKITGMGLSVAQGVVHSHEGAIEVETQDGKGTLFTVWLPLHPRRLEDSASGA